MQINVSYDIFFDGKQYGRDIYSFFATVAKQTGVISFSFLPASVEVLFSNQTIGDQIVVSPAQILIPKEQIHTIGARLLLPFAMTLSQISFPSQSCLFLLFEGRNIANVVLKSYLFAVSRGISVEIFNNHRKDVWAQHRSQHFKLKYLWILRNYFLEPYFYKSNPLELLFLNAHLPVCKFSNALLDIGVNEMRNLFKKKTECDKAALLEDILFLRKKILNC
ncbi:MAG TPA: hypothetical protein PKC79_06875 [Solidesulfovibrio magneticus]|nr:hypothetical protein [Solidesulfovibrio magneticus]